MPENYYRTLNISPDAKPEEIQRAYRSLARRYHPDLNSAPAASNLMAVINEAYEILSEPKRRAEYDRKHQKQNDKYDEPIMQAAKEALLKSGWNVSEESSCEFILKQGSRQVYVALAPLLTAPVLRRSLLRSTGFSVVMAVRIEPEITVPGLSIAVIDLLHSRLAAGEFPDPCYQDLFKGFLVSSNGASC